MTDSIKLHPPQQYLITDLLKTKNIDNVLSNAMERNKGGVQLYMPVCKLHFCSFEMKNERNDFNCRSSFDHLF